jgi:hypothetical protein
MPLQRIATVLCNDDDTVKAGVMLPRVAVPVEGHMKCVLCWSSGYFWVLYLVSSERANLKVLAWRRALVWSIIITTGCCVPLTGAPRHCSGGYQALHALPPPILAISPGAR